jgi:hypothetical protein
MCPAYAKKAGNERKKWAKLVLTGVDTVQSSTGVEFIGCVMDRTARIGCTGKGIKSTNKVHSDSDEKRMIQIRA